MSKYAKDRSDFYELSKHSTYQIGVFLFLLVAIIFITFLGILETTEVVVEKNLSGKINNSDSLLSKNLEKKEPKKQTSYLKQWAIDIGEKEQSLTRYWLHPVLSFAVPAMLLGLMITLIVSTILPRNIGFMRQKIEREIMFQLDKLYYRKYGVHSEDHHNEIANDIANSDLRKLHDMSKEYDTLYDDLETLRKAILWRNGNTIKSMAYSLYAMIFYMKFYFTEKYNNTVMGMVYIGAAVLIIIIGMRGLKFIPSTEPSLVFFALGLEFSLLITYAFTLMFSRQENEQEKEQSSNGNSNLLAAHDLDNAADIENLLRMFISESEKKEIKH